MEISIKWNVCRVCLQEPDETGSSNPTTASSQMRCIFVDPKLAKQIYDCTGVMMKPNDCLPEKICRQCLSMLKYAVNFRTSCRTSNDYLQSVIRKTKSATSLFKLDKQREDLVDGVIEQIFDKDDVDGNALECMEEGGHGDSANDKRMNRQIMISTNHSEHGRPQNTDNQIPLTSGVDPYEASESNQSYRDSINEARALSRTLAKSSLLKKSNIRENPKELSIIELVEQDSDDELKQDQVVMEEQTMDEIEYQRDHFPHVSSECSVEDDGYIEDGDEQDKISNLDDLTAHENTYVDADVPMTKSYIVLEASNEARDIADGSSPTRAIPAAETTIPNNDNEEAAGMFYLVNEQESKPDIEQYTMIEMTTERVECYQEKVKSELTEAIEEEDYLVDETVEQNHAGTVKKVQALHSSSVSVKPRRHISSLGARKSTGSVSSFVCEVCGNNFSSRSQMNYHMRIHRNEKKFECELCFKRFNTACNLSAHMRIHTGEKRYACQFCGRRFTDRSTHTKHERTHTNEKPFICEVCGKAFSLSTTLKAHEKIHTGERPFGCATCDKSFKLRHQLKAHLNSQLHKVMSEEANFTTKPSAVRFNKQ